MSTSATMTLEDFCQLLRRANKAKHDTYRITIFSDGTGYIGNEESGYAAEFTSLEDLISILNNFTRNGLRTALDEQIALQEELLSELRRKRDELCDNM